MSAGPVEGGAGSRVRAFLVGSPRSRTTAAQTLFSQACGLVTMSTNWWLTPSGTWLLNGPEGEPWEVTRPFAQRRVRDRLAEVGVELPPGFGVAEALDRVAAEAGKFGAVGWLEKTPLHVLALAEIEGEVAGARFVHLVRNPLEVVASFLRRAAANPTMRGAAWQSVQVNCEAVWRACVAASLAVDGEDGHLLVDSERFVAEPEPLARRVAGLLGVPYRPPDHPGRVVQAGAARPSERPWKRDAAGPVRRIEHGDGVRLAELEPETRAVWQRARAALAAEATEW